MLRLTIPDKEYFDEKTETFSYKPGRTIQLEHSLISISKWESKWHKPFLSNAEKTVEERLDYIRCMTITQNVPPDDYYSLGKRELDIVDEYVNDPMTATTFGGNDKKKPNNKPVTSEVIYYWMTVYGIPFDCEKWNLNRLMTLIRVCDDKQSPKKKKSKNEIINNYRALNEARRKKYNTRG